MKKVIPWAFLVTCFVFGLYYVSYNYYVLMNSDSSTELLLGKVLAENGGFITDRWIYGNELRVFHNQIIYKLVYLFTGDNWYIYRLVSDAIFLAMLLSSYIFMANTLGMKNKGIWTAGILVLPLSPIYGYMIDYGAYYIPHLVFMFLTLAFMIRYINASGKKYRLLYAVFLMAVGMMSGTGGVRGAMICYVPAFVASFLMLIGATEKKDYLVSKEWRLMVANIMAIASFGIGFLINKLYFSSKYLYLNQSEYEWGRFTPENIGNAIEHLIKTAGIFEHVSFLGPLGISNAAAISLIVFVIYSMNRLKKASDTPFEIVYYRMFTLSALVTTFIVVGSLEPGGPPYYWTPVLPLFIPFLGMVIPTGDITDKIAACIPKILCVYISFAVLYMSVATLKYPIEPRYSVHYDRSSFVQCGEFLTSSGYKQGFAPFWIANHFIELSNGTLDIWTVNDSNMDRVDDISYEFKCLQEKAHVEELPQGPFFIITYSRNLDPDYSVKCPFYKSESNMIYLDDYFTVYGFKDMEEYKKLLKELQE